VKITVSDKGVTVNDPSGTYKTGGYASDHPDAENVPAGDNRVETFHPHRTIKWIEFYSEGDFRKKIRERLPLLLRVPGRNVHLGIEGGSLQLRFVEGEDDWFSTATTGVNPIFMGCNKGIYDDILERMKKIAEAEKAANLAEFSAGVRAERLAKNDAKKARRAKKAARRAKKAAKHKGTSFPAKLWVAEPEPEAEVTFEFTRPPIGLILGEDPDNEKVTVITEVEEGGMAAETYGNEPLLRVVEKVNGEDVTELDYKDTMDLIEAKTRPLILVTSPPRAGYKGVQWS